MNPYNLHGTQALWTSLSEESQGAVTGGLSAGPETREDGNTGGTLRILTSLIEFVIFLNFTFEFGGLF